MRPPQRFLAAGIAIGLVEAVIGIPLVGTVLGWYFWILGAVTVAIAIATHRLLEPPRDDGDDGDGGGGGDPPGGEPPWWPEFEAEFRAYVQDRVRDRAPV